MLSYLRQIDWLALSASALVLVISLWVVSSVFPPDNRHNHNAHKATQELSENFTLAEKTEIRIANYSRWLTVFTGFLALSTVGLWVVTWSGVKRQSEETKILERAYVSVEPGGLRAFNSPDDGYIACDVIFNNAGNLPARNVAWLIERRFDTDKHAKEFPTEAELAGDIVIAPKGRVRKGSPPIETIEFIRWKDEGKFDKTWVYVWGRVTYHDGFVGGRHTNFCPRYNLRGEEWFRIPEENARYHEHGNSTDD